MLHWGNSVSLRVGERQFVAESGGVVTVV